MPECLTYAFHKRRDAPPCGRCAACLTVEPPPPFIAPPSPPPPAALGGAPQAEPAPTGGLATGGPVDPDQAPTVTEGGLHSVEIVTKGGGWREIIDADGQILDRVRGQEAAEARAAELANERED